MDTPVDQPDDLTIVDSDRLLRRIPPIQVVRESDGNVRPSSAAFKDPELSVNIESLMIEQGRLIEEAVGGMPGFSLVAMHAGSVRGFGHPIVKDASPPNDPAHGLVLGKKSKAFFRAMSRTAEWVVPPSAD